jgi:thiamine kinase-like enzyme
MFLKKTFLFFLLGCIAFQSVTFGQGDEETIREVLKKATGIQTFALHISPIKEGLTNRNYKVFLNTTPLFVRLGHKDPRSLGKDIEHVIEIVQKLKNLMPKQQKGLCHQDLVPDNFIFDGTTLYLVDWEYAEWSDPFFDLAALCIEHQFDEEEKAMLLNDYFANSTEEQRIHLEMMCMLYSLRDALWYFIENKPSSQKQCDYIELANYHYKNFFTSQQWLQKHNVAL